MLNINNKSPLIKANELQLSTVFFNKGSSVQLGDYGPDQYQHRDTISFNEHKTNHNTRASTRKKQTLPHLSLSHTGH